MNEQFLLTIFGGLLFFLIIKILVRIPGLMLQSKFKKIGSMVGMGKTDIIRAAGNFQSIRHLADGGSVCVWQAAGYLITIQFDKEQKFLKIISETSVK